MDESLFKVTVARDIEDCQIQVVATKPIARWDMVPYTRINRANMRDDVIAPMRAVSSTAVLEKYFSRGDYRKKSPQP